MDKNELSSEEREKYLLSNYFIMKIEKFTIRFVCCITRSSKVIAKDSTFACRFILFSICLGQMKVKISTAQKMKFSIKDFFSKCDEIQRKLRIWSHLLKKSWMENFIFCAMKFLVKRKGNENLLFVVHSSNFSKIRLFRPMFPFYTPWKRQKAFGFLTILGGIEREHWPENGLRKMLSV